MRVLVTGANSSPGIDLLTHLGNRGIPACGHDARPRSRHDGIPVYGSLAPGQPGFIDEIRHLIAGNDVRWLFPTRHAELPLLARARIQQAVMATPTAIEIAHDKWLTTTWLARAGVAVAHTVRADQAHPSAGAIIGVPYVTKPRVAEGGAGLEIRQTWPPAGLGASHIACEYLPGPEYRTNLYLTDDAAVAVVVEERADGEVVVEAPDVHELAIDACRAIGLTGPACVDVRRRRSGQPVVLEVNARFTTATPPIVLNAALEHVGA